MNEVARILDAIGHNAAFRIMPTLVRRVMRHPANRGVPLCPTRHNQRRSRKANSSSSARNRPGGMSNGVTLARASSFCNRSAWR